MRNSNILSVAPTATIANIAGCYPCIEPIYKNIYVKSNIAGEFTIVNKYLVQDLKKHNLWSKDMLDQLKMYDGELGMIESIPMSVKHKYKTAFELDPEHLIKVTAARGKWIDQSQSHNVFMQGVSGKKLNDIYIAAWKCGLKTTYYLRTLGATGIEKASLKTIARTQTRSKPVSTLGNGVSGSNGMANGSTVTQATTMNATNGQTAFAFGCDITNDECESCQ